MPTFIFKLSFPQPWPSNRDDSYRRASSFNAIFYFWYLIIYPINSRLYLLLYLTILQFSFQTSITWVSVEQADFLLSFHFNFWQNSKHVLHDYMSAGHVLFYYCLWNCLTPTMSMLTSSMSSLLTSANKFYYGLYGHFILLKRILSLWLWQFWQHYWLLNLTYMLWAIASVLFLYTKSILIEPSNGPSL